MKKTKADLILLFPLFVILACLFTLYQAFSFPRISSTSARISTGEDSIAVNDNWYKIDDDGSYLPFDDFNKNLDSKDITISRMFLYDEEGRNTLLFANDFCAVEVYQDDCLIYSYGTQEDLDNGILLGYCYCTIPLDIYFGEASEISIRFRSQWDIQIHGFELGTPESMVSRRFLDFIPTLLCIIVAFIAIILLLGMIYFGKKNHVVNGSYSHFLAFLALISVWGLTDTQILGGLGIPAGTICIVSFETFMMFLIPFFLFMYHSFDSMRKCDILMAFLLSLNFVVLNVLQFTGKASFVDTLISTHICIILSIVLVLVQILVERKRNRSNMNASLFIGFLCLLTFSFVQLAAYYFIPHLKNSGFLQIGLVIFVVIQILYIVKNLFKKVDEGFQAETYLELAKTDSLTGLGNRRGLDFLIEGLAKQHSGIVRVGCVVCDLNDLKETNDSYGHNAGDKLITDFAGCISRCYQDVGVPFRTGGDEFYILFCNVEVDMNAMLRRLDLELERCNFTRAIHVSCSSGAYADYIDSSDQKAVWDIIKKADEEMYVVKKKDREKRKIEK